MQADPGAMAWLRKEWLLCLSATLALVLAIVDPQPWSSHLHWLDGATVATLFALLVVTEGVRSSGYVQRFARRLLGHLGTVRQLALVLVALAALLSMGLTNDVSLFLMVPLTLAMGRVTPLPLARLVVFEALAVNAGSTLSPIGNPQNLLLWQRSGLSFFQFVTAMAPTFAVIAVLLVVATWAAFPRTRMHLDHAEKPSELLQPVIAATSLVLLVLVVGLVQYGHAFFAAALVAVVFMFFFRGCLKRLDWALLATFASIFLALGHLTSLPGVQALAHRLDWNSPMTLYLGSGVLSQLISNVPATVLLSHFTSSPITLAIGANIGGFGLAIGSLANLIALRLEGNRATWWTFHLYSVPFLLVAGGAVAVLVAWG
jgi:Na+/H+ antiporter NhaD/arsenite permease-like protein